MLFDMQGIQYVFYCKCCLRWVGSRVQILKGAGGSEYA